MCRASHALDGVSALGVQCVEPKKSPATRRGQGGFPNSAQSLPHHGQIEAAALSVYFVSPNRWPTWPRVNIQVASLVN